jgi:hypothetical protein
VEGVDFGAFFLVDMLDDFAVLGGHGFCLFTCTCMVVGVMMDGCMCLPLEFSPAGLN